MKRMRLEQFEKLISGRRFGRERSGQGEGRTLKALRHYLVGGDTAIEACRKAEDLSSAAFYEALTRLRHLPRQRKQLNRERCPHCHQQLPNNTRAPSGTPTSAH